MLVLILLRANEKLSRNRLPNRKSQYVIIENNYLYLLYVNNHYLRCNAEKTIDSKNWIA